MNKFFLVFALFLLLMSCGEEETIEKTSADQEATRLLIQSLNIDEDLKEIANLSIAEPLPVYSISKINEDLNAGNIEKPDAVLYTLLASYAPDILPSEYQGEAPETDFTMESRWWMYHHWDELDEQTKEKLEPFYVLPDDPKSFFYSDEKQNEVLESFSIIPSVQAADIWKSFQVVISEEPDRRVTIFYKAGNEQRAQWVNESILLAYPMFESLLGVRPAEMSYLYLKPIVNGSGEADMITTNNFTRCVMSVAPNKSQKKTQSTAAHELFHCFQFAIPLKYEGNPTMWLMEATAEWSEHYVYPDYNMEWANLPGYFQHTEKKMIFWDGSHEYESYMWYLFLTQSTGNLEMVKEPLFNAKTMDDESAATSFEFFDTFFAEYALWNWNKEPFEQYTDLPNFPRPTLVSYSMSPNGDAFVENYIEESGEFPAIVELQPLSMKYNYYIFNDNLKKVIFNFKIASDEKHARQALIKIGNTWHLEDWTTIDERKFCKTRSEENVKAVILIYSNSQTRETYTKDFVVDTRGECDPEWHGYTKFSWSFTTDFDFGGGLTQNYEQQSSMISYDTLIYDEEWDEFYVKTQMLNYNYEEKQTTKYPEECGPQSTILWNTLKGTQNNQWEIDGDNFYDSDAPIRLSGSDDEFGMYDVDMEISKRDFTGIDKRIREYKRCEFEGLFAPGNAPSSSEISVSSTSGMGYTPIGIVANRSEDGKQISGMTTFMMPWGTKEYPIQVEVDYRYG
ncbi:MAG: hypothetical protein WC254_00245 [Candidatus Woesearchaeota archaeon]|jgi:hypothetical protein